MSWWALAGMAGLSGLSSGLDLMSSSIMNNSSNAKNKRSMLTQFWMQKYLMDQQNEYNKPINQMKRLAEAGLNPNLVYENGGTTVAAASGSAPSYSRASTSSMSLDYLGKMSMLSAMEQQEAQTRSINTNIGIAKAELELKKEMVRAQIRSLNSSTANNNASAGIRYEDLRQLRSIGSRSNSGLVSTIRGLGYRLYDKIFN